jgi:hypothetical protein
MNVQFFYHFFGVNDIVNLFSAASFWCYYNFFFEWDSVSAFFLAIQSSHGKYSLLFFVVFILSDIFNDSEN